MAAVIKRDIGAVSFDSEPLILVDANDREIGCKSKVECHAGHGILHRAFSIFIFDSQGRVLLQKRSAGKLLWGGYWSNSCCSHPRRGESMGVATRRRLAEELGLEAELHFLYKFIYQADFGDVGAEHELCWVFIGRSDRRVRVHSGEIAAWRYASLDAIARELTEQPDSFTPWFKLEWRHMMKHHRAEIESLCPVRRWA